MTEYCCYQMREQLTTHCGDHPRKSGCPDTLVIETQSGIAIPIKDGGSSYMRISFCPWCGSSLHPDLKPQQHGYTENGTPRFNPLGKIEALNYCVRENQRKDAEPAEMLEDILGHLCDLIVYYAKQNSMTTVGVLKNYGKNSDGAIFPVNYSMYNKRKDEFEFVEDPDEN